LHTSGIWLPRKHTCVSLATTFSFLHVVLCAHFKPSEQYKRMFHESKSPAHTEEVPLPIVCVSSWG
jgi:hypothetical protein